MDEKFTLKIIQNGQTQQAKVLRTGAGISGQAVVLNATDATRYQLVNVVTLASPQKLKLKRIGADLQMSLPGGDVDAPDLVIKDYFNATGVSLQGASISGEWMTYDTVSMSTAEASVSSETSDLTRQSISQTSTASLASVTPTLGAVLETPWGLAGLGLGVAAAAGGGGGGGGGSTAVAAAAVATEPLEIIKAYSEGGTSSTPTLANYKAAGLYALSGLTVATALDDIATGTSVVAIGTTTWETAINSAANATTDKSSLTTAKLQEIANSYFRILSEADGVVNTTTNTDIHQETVASTDNDPTRVDYTNIAVSVGNDKSLDLLNDFVGLSSKSAVDTVTEINTIARAAYNVMVTGGVAVSLVGTVPVLYSSDSTTEVANWIAGLTALGVSGVNSANVTDIKSKIALTTGGTGIDTVLELKTLLTPVIALQVLRDYASSVSGSGGVEVPSITTYKDAGIKGLTNVSATSATEDIDSSTVYGALSYASAAQLLGVLNTALDKRTDGSTLTVVQIQAMVDSYYRILTEADGVVNTTTNTDVYGGSSLDDPTLVDYQNIGATVGNQKTVDLLNDQLGLSNKTAVDTVDEINALAEIAYNVMRTAGITADTATTPVLYSSTPTTETEKWRVGLLALGISGVNGSNIAAIKQAIQTATSTGVDTVLELSELLNPVIALQVLRDYSTSVGGAGALETPSLTTYKNAGIKLLTGLNQASATADIDNAIALGALGVSYSNWLASLNAALDKRTDGSTLTVVQIQSLVDSYYRILSEADGVVNTSTNVDVHSETGSTTDNNPTTTDYTNIGVTIGNDKSIELLNDFVGLSNKTAVDSLIELDAISKIAYNVMIKAGVAAATGTVPATYANTPSGNAEWIAGLALLGITGVDATNIAAIKLAIDASNNDGSGVDTVLELKTLIDTEIALQILRDYASASGGVGVSVTPTLSTYKNAGLKTLSSLSASSATLEMDNTAIPNALGISSGNWLSAINNALDKRTDSSTFTVAQLQSMVDSYYRILSEADGTVNTTTNVDVYGAVTGTGQGKDDPSASDYTNIGATIGNSKSVDLLNDVVGSTAKFSSSTTLTSITVIDVIAKAAYNVMLKAGTTASTGAGIPTAYADDSTGYADWKTGLEALKITGVTESNVAEIKAAIVATSNVGTINDGEEVDTIAELQDVVSLVRMKAYTNDTATAKSAPTPTLADWGALVQVNKTLSDASLVDLNLATYWKDTNASNGLIALNSVLDEYAGSTLTVLDLKTIADSYGRILQTADGIKTNSIDIHNINGIAADTALKDTDLDALKLTITDTVLGMYVPKKSLLRGVIAASSSTAVDTVAELNVMLATMDEIFKQVNYSGGSTYTNDQWLTALTSLSVTGASTTNIAAIKTYIDGTVDAGTDIDTYDELQGVVSLIRVRDYGVSNTSSAPNIRDYQVLAGTASNDYADAKSGYVSAYNTVVDLNFTSISTKADVQNLVLAYNKILDSADGVGTAAVATAVDADYANIGVTIRTPSGITAGKAALLLNDCISGLSTTNVDTVAELQSLEGVIFKIMTMAMNTKTSGAVSSDYAGLSRSDLGLLGLKGASSALASDASVTDAEMVYFSDSVVYSANTGADVDTFVKLQSLVNTAIINA